MQCVSVSSLSSHVGFCMRKGEDVPSGLCAHAVKLNVRSMLYLFFLLGLRGMMEKFTNDMSMQNAFKHLHGQEACIPHQYEAVISMLLEYAKTGMGTFESGEWTQRPMAGILEGIQEIQRSA